MQVDRESLFMVLVLITKKVYTAFKRMQNENVWRWPSFS